jgi:hypothetical protein
LLGRMVEGDKIEIEIEIEIERALGFNLMAPNDATLLTLPCFILSFFFLSSLSAN